jgi:superfamily I DNA and RNA helicase
MQINIASEGYSQNRLAEQIVDYLEVHQDALGLNDAVLYYEFPLFKELDENVEYPSFMIISPNHGVIIIQCDERSQRTLTEELIQQLNEGVEQLYSFVFSKLIKIANLRRKGTRNQLLFDVHTVLYLPSYSRDIMENDSETKIVKEIADLKDILDALMIANSLPQNVMDEVYSVIEGSRGVTRAKNRNITDETRHLKGGLLEDLEKEIAKFDKKQKLAALTQIDGPQRIRGLAGSGKTVVLAMKAALIHLRKPNAKILYTFSTKSLYDHIKQLITRFYRMHQDNDPDWEFIHIRHAWGGANIPGVYYDACKNNNVMPIKLNDAKAKGRSPFDYVCLDLLDKTAGTLCKSYDYVLMDEGQDFSPPFYWICRKIVKNDCLVWAYDELQNILHVDMQKTIDVFKNHYGDEGIDLEELQKDHPRQNNDIVLHRCYRNPKEILVVAHAIGFGIYNDRIVQRLENREHWEDIGYEVEKGNCVQGEHTIIHRPESNSPSSISLKQSVQELIKTYIADNVEEEVEWVCNSIKEDINEHLLPEDILVIAVDDRHARKYFEIIKQKLMHLNIRTNNILESYTGDDFIIEGCVTLSTVYRAKGNEAGVVYVVGTDALSGFYRNDITARNKLFTAFTRSKAWLRISGIRTGFEALESLFGEIKSAISKLPNLDFVYPGKEEIKTLRREFADENRVKVGKMRALQEKLDELGLSYEDAIGLLQTEKKGQ